MTTSLVTLTEIKDHLYIQSADTTHDNDLSLKIEIVSDIIMDFLKLTEPPDEWYDDESPPVLTIPGRVRGVALLGVAEMYEHREASMNDVLSDKIKDILRRTRDPALA